jgi:hypothetical protein
LQAERITTFKQRHTIFFNGSQKTAKVTPFFPRGQIKNSDRIGSVQQLWL